MFGSKCARFLTLSPSAPSCHASLRSRLKASRHVDVTAMLSFASHSQYRRAFPTIRRLSRCTHSKTGSPFPQKLPASDGQIGHIGSQTVVTEQGGDSRAGRDAIKRINGREIVSHTNRQFRNVLFLQKHAAGSAHDSLTTRASTFSCDGSEADFVIRCGYSQVSPKNGDPFKVDTVLSSCTRKSNPHAARRSARSLRDMSPMERMWLNRSRVELKSRSQAALLDRSPNNVYVVKRPLHDYTDVTVYQPYARYKNSPHRHHRLHTTTSKLEQSSMQTVRRDFLSDARISHYQAVHGHVPCPSLNNTIHYNTSVSQNLASPESKISNWCSHLLASKNVEFEPVMRSLHRGQSSFWIVFSASNSEVTVPFPADPSSRHQRIRGAIASGKIGRSGQFSIKRIPYSIPTFSFGRKFGFMRTSIMHAPQSTSPVLEPFRALDHHASSDSGTRSLPCESQLSNNQYLTPASNNPSTSPETVANSKATLLSEDKPINDIIGTEEQHNNDAGTMSKDEYFESENDQEEEEDHIPLSFQIPLETLRTAIQAPEGTNGSFWSQALYRDPDDKMLLVHYCKSMEVSERVAGYFLKEQVLGFDIEWKPTALPHKVKDNVSLIQIASGDRIALFHIAQHKGKTPDEIIPPSLKKIIESPGILKAGVAIKADFSRVKKYLGLDPRGVFEISRLHNLVVHFGTDREDSRMLVALATQIKQHLLLPLFKGNKSEDGRYDEENVRVSDWTAVLQKDQIEYAASDAYAGLRLFDILESKRKRLRPRPTRPPVCDNDKPVRKKPSKTTNKKATPEAVEESSEEEKEIQEKVEKQAKVNDDESMEELYVTAEEDMGKIEQSESEPSSAESSSSFADEGSDTDVDYMPPSQEFQHLSLDSEPRTRPRRIGRVAVSTAKTPNLEYPRLPMLLSEQESSLDSSDAFDITSPRSKRITTSESPASPKIDSSKVSPNPLASYPVVQNPTPDMTIASRSSEYLLASQWAISHLNNTIPDPTPIERSDRPSRLPATLSHLRAYHMWHHQRLPLSNIAGILREPPLALSTVSKYIVQATMAGGLEYDERDMREVLKYLPAVLRSGKWKWKGFVKKVEGEAVE